MRRLLDLIARQVGLSYADITAWLEDVNSLAEIEDRILRGNYSGAIVRLDDAALKLAADIQASYVTAGQRASEWLDGNLPDKLVRFDTASPAIVARARANQLELVQGFREEQWAITRQITQRAIVESATVGTNPRRIAQDFRTSIGLTAQQEEWVSNYRRALEQGDYLRATGYELSSGQADRTLRSYADKDKTLTPAQVDDFTERYRQNAITYRAETIARTEALRNAHEGTDDAMRQAIARGDIAAQDLDVEWHAGPATLDARPDHQAMNGVKVPFGTDFVLPDGTRMSGPGDPRGGAKHCASCRCAKSVAFAFGKRRAPVAANRPACTPARAYVHGGQGPVQAHALEARLRVARR